MTMKIEVTNKKKNPAVTDYTRQRFELAVGRFASRIAHAAVHLTDENAAKGGEDKVCSVDIKLSPRGHVHVRAKHSSVYAAIGKALHRAEAVISKTIDRSQRSSRPRHRTNAVSPLTPDAAIDASAF